MAQGNFPACLAFDERKDIEGGNDDDPNDPGGRTSRGIEQREWDAWCHLHNQPKSDVWTAPQAGINAIFEHSYWQPYSDLIPKGLDLMYFDIAVNEGVGKAVLFLQRALKIPDGGHFGIVTASKVKGLWEQPAVIKSMIRTLADERRADYHRMRKFGRYGKGWLARVDKCEAASLEMAK